jgi:DNA-binding LacI/PurR family transcriptional regulator
MHAIGEAAAEALSQMIDDPETRPVQRIVPTRLVVRSSTVNGAPRERTLAPDKEVR